MSHACRCLPILYLAFASMLAAPAVSAATSQADCLFGWAENNYPALFSPPAAASLTAPPYYYRFYPAAQSYLGASVLDNHVYYLAPQTGGMPRDLGMLATLAGSVNCPASASTASGSSAFTGSIVLGSPTRESIRASILSPGGAGIVYLAYGRTPGSQERQTAPAYLGSGGTATLLMDGLQPDARYYYRLYFLPTAGGAPANSEEFSFRTARPAGSTFTFTIQADSHLDENSDLRIYQQTLKNALADAPDFHIDLGDTFMCEKHSEPLTATVRPATDAATVVSRYRYEHGNFGLITHSVPLYLANGNHDAELGWLNDGTARNLAVWATQARHDHFPNPVPDGFYTGDSVDRAFVGKRAAWYAWTWGDALFIVLDPFWDTTTKSNTDGWVFTLGERQYRWLQSTLQASSAKFKFVFLHNLVGGLDGQMRGGVEAAPYYEWGGRNADGTSAFAQKRPGWAMPIHPLLVQYGVTAVFHGHDHLYARQQLDGIVYQAVPQPSARNSSSGAALAAEYHYTSGTILSSSGHLRITVGPTQVTSEYVRAWLPASETAQRRNRQVDDLWSVSAR